MVHVPPHTPVPTHVTLPCCGPAPPLQYRKSFQRGPFHLGFLSIPIGMVAVTWVIFLTVSAEYICLATAAAGAAALTAAVAAAAASTAAAAAACCCRCCCQVQLGRRQRRLPAYTLASVSAAAVHPQVIFVLPTDICPHQHLQNLTFSHRFQPQVIFVLPTAYPVTKENLNYAGVAVAVVLIFSLG